MIPIDEASNALNPRRIAPRNVMKIPSWAAAPKSKLLGLEISGPKSVVAPIPRKISGGKISHSIPLWKEYNRPKASPFDPSLYRDGAKFTNSIPIPIGINR